MDPAPRPSPARSGPLQPAAPEFAALYEANNRVIYYLCLRLLGDADKAQDATHDTFLKAWRHWDRFEGRSSWRTWLYRIAINHCRNLQRSWAEHHLIATDDDHLLRDTLADTATPFRVLEIQELGERIQRALDRLPPDYRLLLLLVADRELTYAAIAELTQQSPDGVRGKLHRARKAFVAAFLKSA